MAKTTREEAIEFLEKEKGVMTPSQFITHPVYYEPDVVIMIENAIKSERGKKRR